MQSLAARARRTCATVRGDAAKLGVLCYHPGSAACRDTVAALRPGRASRKWPCAGGSLGAYCARAPRRQESGVAKSLAYCFLLLGRVDGRRQPSPQPWRGRRRPPPASKPRTLSAHSNFGQWLGAPARRGPHRSQLSEAASRAKSTTRGSLVDPPKWLWTPAPRRLPSRPRRRRSGRPTPTPPTSCRRRSKSSSRSATRTIKQSPWPSREKVRGSRTSAGTGTRRLDVYTTTLPPKVWF